jgi:hypothetical protein
LNMLHVTCRNKKIHLGIFVGLIGLLSLSSCGFGQRDKEESNDASSAERAAAVAAICDPPMQSAFGQSYHGFLMTNCNSCHVAGGEGKGAFSSPDIGVAFNAFKGSSASRVNSFAVNPNHKPPTTGAQHAAAISGLSSQWDTVENQYQACLASGGGLGGGGLGGLPTGPRIETVAKTMPTFVVPAPGVTTAAQTLTYNLGTEISAPAGTVFAGSSFSFDIKARTSATGETSYVIERPTFTASAASAIQVRDIQIKINDVHVDSATALTTTTRKIPASQNRVLVPVVGGLPTGVFIIERPILPTDRLTVTFGQIITTTFNPPTFHSSRQPLVHPMCFEDIATAVMPQRLLQPGSISPIAIRF